MRKESVEKRLSLKRIGLLLAALAMLFTVLTGCAESADIKTQSKTTAAVAESGQYDSKEDVSAYLQEYDRLPSNYITKKEARGLGWEGGSLEPYAPGKSIGGDRFGNREKLLPQEDRYRECDIDTKGADSRGAKRIVYSDDGDIYYTEDHYKTFTQLVKGDES